MKGVIHAHTKISHDSMGTADEMIRAAREAGLQFIMTTDHNNKRIFTEGPSGKQGDLLVIRGAEIIQGGQALLALHIHEYIEEYQHGPKTIQQIVDEIKAQGGLAFAAHPLTFRDWTVEGIDGLEVYDMADNAMTQAWKLPWITAEAITSFQDYSEEVYLSLLARPNHSLSRWDRLIPKRRLVGIAGNDAHQRFVLMGRKIDPYSVTFRFVQTHLLSPACEESPLVDALKAGHSYFSFGLLADATGFLFTAEGPEGTAIMGDRISYSPGMVLSARTPNTGTIRLFHNGGVVYKLKAPRLDYPVKEKGVYRVEVSLSFEGMSYPWIVSNPIYID